MHILLTDILSCPRCGPDFGLIVLADLIEARRVLDGTLGCANCRSQYPVRGGVADLRITQASSGATVAGSAQSIGQSSESEQPKGDDELAMRWAALMGVAEGPGFLLVAGPASSLALKIAALVDNIEVVAADVHTSDGVEQPGVSRIAVDERLPFYSAKIRGVALSGPLADTLLEEGARVLGVTGRLVLEPAPDDAEERLARVGARVLAKQDRTIVAARTP